MGNSFWTPEQLQVDVSSAIDVSSKRGSFCVPGGEGMGHGCGHKLIGEAGYGSCVPGGEGLVLCSTHKSMWLGAGTWQWPEGNWSGRLWLACSGPVQWQYDTGHG